MQAQVVGERLSRRSVVGGLAGLGASAAGLALVQGCGLPVPMTLGPRVRRIGYRSGARTPEVDRLEVAAAVQVTFRGARAEHVRDRDTWGCVSLPLDKAAQLWRQLGAALTEEEKGVGDVESGPAF